MSNSASSHAPAPLSAAQVKNVKPPATGSRYLRDGATGLQFRVTANGARTWVFRYRPPGSGRKGSQVRYPIGNAEVLSLKDARHIAAQLRTQLANGIDPARARDAERTKARETPRMADLGTQWLDDHVAVKRKPETVRQYRNLWARHVVPKMGAKPVPDVTLHDVDTLHRSLKRTPTTANRVAAMLGSFFTWAEKHGARPHFTNPARGIEKFAESERERFLTTEQIQRLGASLRLAETKGLPPAEERKAKGKKTKFTPKTAGTPIPADAFAIAALRFALLSGWRIGEVVSLRWDALNFDIGAAVLEDTKTGRSERPLGGAALELLAALPRVKGSPWVFPSSRRGFGQKASAVAPERHMGVPLRLWHAVRAHAKLGDVRLHDLRHSFGSTAAGAGNSLVVIASLLGHAHTRTTERYAKARRDVRQIAADAVSGELSALLQGKATPATPMKKRGKG